MVKLPKNAAKVRRNRHLYQDRLLVPGSWSAQSGVLELQGALSASALCFLVQYSLGQRTISEAYDGVMRRETLIDQLPLVKVSIARYTMAVRTNRCGVQSSYSDSTKGMSSGRPFLQSYWNGWVKGGRQRVEGNRGTFGDPLSLWEQRLWCGRASHLELTQTKATKTTKQSTYI